MTLFRKEGRLQNSGLGQGAAEGRDVRTRQSQLGLRLPQQRREGRRIASRVTSGLVEHIGEALEPLHRAVGAGIHATAERGAEAISANASRNSRMSEIMASSRSTSRVRVRVCNSESTNT